MAYRIFSERSDKFILIILLVLGALARLAPIATNRFHQDEAIYSSWALQIATGRDAFLNNFPVDKPPLFIYTLALFFSLFGPSEVTARLPSELASVASLVLLYNLARQLYGRPTALVATALMAFSPFNILFAPTALTDPLMVAWALAALWCAARGRWGWAGAMLGLAAISKPQGLFFAPLVAMIGLGHRNESSATKSGFYPFLHFSLRFGAGFLMAVTPAILWDLVRLQRPGFLQQSLISYGGLSLVAPSQLSERWPAWGELLGYITASRPLNTLLVVGLPCLLLYDLLGRRRERSTLFDFALIGFTLLFLAVHVVLNFNVWDRYLLGLVPLLSLLLARIILLSGQALAHFIPHLSLRQDSKRKPLQRLLMIDKSNSSEEGSLTVNRGSTPVGTMPKGGETFEKKLKPVYSLAVALFLALTLVKPAQDAAASRFPIGGDHGAYQGIEAVADYFRGNVPGGAIIYHHWLGWHFSFYMFDFPYDFRWYPSPRALAEDARRAEGTRRYIVFPSWKSTTEARIALAAEGLALRPVYWTYRRDGSLSFTVYTIEPLDFEAP